VSFVRVVNVHLTHVCKLYIEKMETGRRRGRGGGGAKEIQRRLSKRGANQISIEDLMDKAIIFQRQLKY